MPTVSEPQKHLMLAIDHGWKMPGGHGPSKAVAHDFVEADKKVGRVHAYANGGPVMAKGYQGKSECYAAGGPVLNTTNSRFLKTEDQFSAGYHINPNAGKDKPYGKSGPNAGRGEDPPPAATGKTLKPIKPRS